ncbi:MAG: linear amide C-N hydrolase [Bacillota bacterium]|nr:linear amide C-N hydrolase [Bacillota bacterium]
MCTAIQIDYDKGSVLGRTMDLEYAIDYQVSYYPRGYKLFKDLMGHPYENKYRLMGLSFGSKNPLKDGVNEHGLIGITNEYSLFNLYSKDLDLEKFNVSSMDFMNYALGNFRTVEELLADLDNINISLKNSLGLRVLSPGFHYYFVDSTKRGVVLEPKDGKLQAFENPYKVMTNSPGFLSQEKKLRAYMNLDNLASFNGAKKLPGGYDPSSRFIRAFYLTRTHVPARTNKEALAYSYNILGAMALPKGLIKNRRNDEYTDTKYIAVYDSKEKLLTLKTDLNPQVFQVSLDELIDQEDKLIIPVSREFSAVSLRDLGE